MILTQINKEQAKDTGLAMILILLLFTYIGKYDNLILPAIAVLILTMTWPTIFAPLAKVWFGLSHFLGSIVSKILLSIIFFVLVTPVGLLRQKMGADAMKVRLWKKGKDSVFVTRNRTYSAEDLSKPY